MSLLLDTHFLIAATRGEADARFPLVKRLLTDNPAPIHASVTSIWEIAIKTRLGKLEAAVPLDRIGTALERAGLKILDINRFHAVAYIEPEPETRDPFDRMLLAQCKVEGLKLVTADRALAGHPLVWRDDT